jgi:hypothetical protein
MRDSPGTARSLESAWEAFWADARDLGPSRKGLRRAFKNGAAFIVTGALLRGADDVTGFVHNDIGLLQAMGPWIVKCRTVHPEWEETHGHAIFAGGKTAVLLICTSAPIDLEAFVP